MNRGAFITSAALHAGLAALALLSWPDPAEAPRPPPVPVTLVSAGALEGSPADAPAEEAVAPEFAPEPAPEAPAPDPAPPVSTPALPPPSRAAPSEPAPTPRPTPPPKAAPQRPAPPKPTPPRPAPPRSAPAEQSLDLNALSSRLAKASPRSGGSSRGAPKQAAQAAGPTPAERQGALAQLRERLIEAWNPNCRVEGGNRVNVRVQFRLEKGRVAGRPQVLGGPSSEPLVRAAEERAVRAVYELAPYDWLPEVMQTDNYEGRFNAETACS